MKQLAIMHESQKSPPHLIVDAHVHWYPHYATANTKLAESFLNTIPPLLGMYKVCVLTERADCNFYEDLLSEVSGDKQWQISPESTALNNRERGVTVVPGYQIATRERLEVHMLCSRTRIPDGLSFEETLMEAMRTDALIALPYSLTKWSGARRELITRACAQYRDSLYISDSGMRPRGFSLPSVTTKLPLLFGSDPLPLSGEQSRILSYGGIYKAALDYDEPYSGVRDLLRTTVAERPYGERVSLVGFALRAWRLVRSARGR